MTMDLTTYSREALLELVPKCTWVHSIDLGGGVRTPGRWGVGNPGLVKSLDDVDFKGKRVLDIGCSDGQFSFEAEERGAAEVYATDLVSARPYADHPTFEIAHALRRSEAHYNPNLSVYDVGTLGIRDFDIVLLLGVYYHLRHPLLAFEVLRAVMKPGALLVVEGVVHAGSGSDAEFYHRKLFAEDASNWWRPSVSCLQQWVESCGFAVKREYGLIGDAETPRHVLHAIASGAVVAERPVVPQRPRVVTTDAERQLDAVLTSTSWRITAPLRRLKAMLRR